ncbi:sucrose-6-phosphate hydrolase [Paenibacillus sp. HN-1]|uniref:glycoside hydrolase family 32 protein n=1 Tax=Paenibacillus TaxID=44249 RepID=UPI001CA9549D|nr:MULTISPECIES: sucrose-6-phosphate hydrolase [Paenibacillus]MBY9078328.1 sucrose-6-phosphate hydrolase [Paenibacillus sp. CGMCC 1.18879]MBY9086016.1 sucrose-6-phosphate hydrolase [Paenibacillus sinensis]
MDISNENKYKRIEETSQEEMDHLRNKVKACPWRQSFHVQPITGLLNDPNGFSYFNGEYHLFYQWHPLGPVHGLKYWYHIKSHDLVNWGNMGIGLSPDCFYDYLGAYSGSAIEHDQQLYLFYTGNTRDSQKVRHPYQCMAIMDNNGKITKLKRPVIDTVPEGYTEHFRDPKVWKKDERFYSVIGAQRVDLTGCSVLYSSSNLIDWTFEGELNIDLNSFGYMWECPDYFELDNQGIMLFCPQGIEPEGENYRNIYQSGYVLGEQLNLEQRSMTHGGFIELDRGFDFYAPQTMVTPDGRRIIVGWMGLPDIETPTDRNGWAHCLTLPRELSVRGGKLIQQPVPELQSLRKKEYTVSDTLNNEVKTYNGFQGRSYELTCEFNTSTSDEFGIEILASSTEKTVIKYNSTLKKVTLDRSHSGEAIASEYGSERACVLIDENIKFHIFVDHSSVEVFVNDGEVVFTSRVFPSIDSNIIRFFAHGGQTAFTAVKWDY